jgi:hypothetical protein
MIGYWDKDCPVKTNHPDVLATAFVRNGQALIAVGSWAKENRDIKLTLDAARLGFKDGESPELEAPEIQHFQPHAEFQLGQDIPIEPQKGWIFLVKKRQ